MTAEEYIDDLKGEALFHETDYVEWFEAKEAVSMARKEEREKAINAFVKAIEGHKIIDGEYYSLILLNRFKELLNKEL